MQDRQIKVLLIIIAGLLAANLCQSMFKSQSSPADVFVNAAQAQSNSSNRGQKALPPTVRSLKGYTVEDLRNVVALGDGQSFVVSNTKGFMVYQVAPVNY